MERFVQVSLSSLRKKFLSVSIMLLVGAMLAGQNIASSALLRFPLWYVLEESPLNARPLKDNENEFFFATSGIRELTPYFIEGLVYGWEFSYTPSDNLRGVKEYFEIKSIVQVDKNDPRFRYTDSFVTNNASVVESWVEYDLDEKMMHERRRWHGASFPTIGGIGSASVFDGIGSVKTACEAAAKNAIREYAVNITKNKPKEINGKILLVDFPRYYIDAGKYVADLDFFLNVSKIVEYTKF